MCLISLSQRMCTQTQCHQSLKEGTAAKKMLEITAIFTAELDEEGILKNEHESTPEQLQLSLVRFIHINRISNGPETEEFVSTVNRQRL